MQTLPEKYDNDQLTIHAISVIGSKKSTESYINGALRNKAVACPILMNGRRVQKMFKSRGVPNTFIMDQEGNVWYRHRGFSDTTKKYIEMEINSIVENY